MVTQQEQAASLEELITAAPEPLKQYIIRCQKEMREAQSKALCPAAALPLDYASIKLLMNPFLMPQGNVAAYRIRACEKEPWTVKFIEDCPSNSIFCDIGACVGSYTLIAIARGLRVLAVEPSIPNLNSLFINLALNDMLDKCQLFWAALGPQNGRDWFHYSSLFPGAANHILGGPRTVFFHKQAVPVLAFDTLWGMLPPDERAHGVYIKCDVDGGELGVIEGMQQALHDEALRGMMVEIDLNEEEHLVRLLAEAGLKQIERFDHRGEIQIGKICYGRFERA